MDHYPWADRQQLRSLADDLLSEYLRNVEGTIDDLQGDGALTVDEVVDELGQQRLEWLNRLTGALQARVQGHEPPPQPDEFDPTYRYHLAMARYVFLQRNDTEQWLWVLAKVGIGVLAGWILAKVFHLLARTLWNHYRRVSARTISLSKGPLYMVGGLVALYLALKPLWFPEGTEEVIYRAFLVLLILVAFWWVWYLCWAVAEIMAPMAHRTGGSGLEAHFKAVTRRVLRVAMLVVFLLIVVNVLFQSNLTQVVAGLGVIGIALSFAMRHLLQNVMASFSLMADQPVRVGEMAIYQGTWGSIEDIGLRSTRFRTFDGHLIAIPNDEFINAAINNVSARPFVRRRFRLGLSLRNSADKVREAIQIIKDILEARKEHQHPDQPYHAMFVDYGEYEIQILIQYCYAPPDYWGAKEFDSEVNLEILQRFNEAGIDLAIPARANRVEEHPERLRVLVEEKDMPERRAATG
jgi:MscS family membrane protein